ncbi:MAG: TonB-dependent receptor plug domain-containing protein [Rhizobacter sp.]|nr:TonB-dependent receptor plug domain-containing protein [Chlorobiales bacterium]
MKIIAVMLILLFTTPHFAAANTIAGGAVVGLVVLAESGAPLVGVVLRVEMTRLQTVSDAAGRFRLDGIAAGTAVIVAGRFGLATKTFPVQVIESDSVEVLFKMEYGIFQAEEVVVTAKESTSGTDGSTASQIERAAIEHVQASSLADVLQLVPGQLAENPLLSSTRQSLLRQVPTNADGDRANALGTAVVLDGAPVSNNANLQTDVTILNSPAGTLPPFASAAGRGLDLRQFSADNIESVEVIRGVPSAKYGDLTAGAILIQTRAGAFAPQSRVRLNASTFEATAGSGWNLNDARTGLSIDGNFTRSQDDPRRAEERYTRFTGQAAWSQVWDNAKRLTTTARLSLFTTIDERLQYPDDLQYQREQVSRDRGLRLNLDAALWLDENLNEARTTKLQATASFAYADQYGYYQSQIARAIFPLTTATDDTTLIGTYGASTYLNQTTTQGKPLNFYARLEGSSLQRFLNWQHTFVAGVEWRTDANAGAGRQFDVTRPPLQNYNVGDRPRTYADVPALSLFSAYLEERATGKVFEKNVRLAAGVRFDNVQPRTPFDGLFGTVIAPRLNASLEVAGGAWLRGGYGITAKAPTLSVLYPGPRYFDIVNLNYYSLTPSERLTIITTRVLQPETQTLRAATATKSELGAEVNFGGASATLTLFEERTLNAFGTNRLAIVYPYQTYRITATPAGQPPSIEPAAIDTFIGAYDQPTNSRQIYSRGLELAADFPEWKAVRTAVNLGAAWIQSRTTDNAVEINTDALFSAGGAKPVGVFASGEGNEATRLVTSVRLVHQAPALQLIVSMLVQTVWIDRDRLLGLTSVPVGYFDKSGQITPLTPEEALLPQYAALQRPVAPELLREENRPALWLFNLRVTKELPPGLRIAFFVNNLLADRPLYQINRAADTQTIFARRSQPIFFGAEILLTL